jgi:hypothetical protein
MQNQLTRNSVIREFLRYSRERGVRGGDLNLPVAGKSSIQPFLRIGPLAAWACGLERLSTVLTTGTYTRTPLP